MNLAIKTGCVYAIIFLIALSVAVGFRYKADKDYDKARRLIDREAFGLALPLMISAVRANPYSLQYRNSLNGLVLVASIKDRGKFVDRNLLVWSIEESIVTALKFPDHYFSYYVTAQGYHVLGLKKQAEAYYRKAIELHPYKPNIKEKLNKLLHL